MNTKKIVTTLFAAALLAVPAAGIAGQGKQHGADKAPPQDRAQVERGQRDMGSDRLRQHDRSGVAQHDRDRIQDRAHAPDGMQQDANNIYGYNLMSEEERNAYRQRIQNAENRQEREQIEAQHRHEMQIRAANKGVEIEDPVKAQKGKDDS
jgi:hypothetical protein